MGMVCWPPISRIIGMKESEWIQGFLRSCDQYYLVVMGLFEKGKWEAEVGVQVSGLNNRMNVVPGRRAHQA